MSTRRRYWLMKSEPGDFSIDDLARVRTEPWTGVLGGLPGAAGEDQALGGAGASRGTPSSVTSRMRAWIAVRPCRAARSARCSPVSR